MCRAREITSDSHKEQGGEAQTLRNKSAGGEAAAALLRLVKDKTSPSSKEVGSKTRRAGGRWARIPCCPTKGLLECKW